MRVVGHSLRKWAWFSCTAVAQSEQFIARARQNTPPDLRSRTDAHLIGKRVRGNRDFATEVSMKVTDYLTPRMQFDIGVSGQPDERQYFHRPMSVLLNACFDCDLVLDRLEEPALPPSSDPIDQRTISWRNISLLPQA